MNVAFSIVDGCNTDWHPLVLLIMYFKSLVLITTVALVLTKLKTNKVLWYICSLHIKKKNLATLSNQVRTNLA